MTVEELNEKIAAQGNKVGDLKAAKADKATLTAEVNTLLALKAEFKTAFGSDWKPGMDLSGTAKENKPTNEPKVTTVYLGARGPSGDRRPRDRVNHGEPTDRRPRAGDPPNEFLLKMDGAGAFHLYPAATAIVLGCSCM
jgi:hypothetical protein